MLIKVHGGSIAYGLNTPESDVDYRGIFINTDPAKILGLEKYEHAQKQEADDELYYEVRKFFELLRNGNTGAIEILFSGEMPIETSVSFETLIRPNKHKFIDTNMIFKCLLGYIQGERRLANGERTGVLGGKRKNELEKYGFSPKNSVQLLRLAFCGKVLFQKGYFPVNIREENEEVWKHLLSIKTKPANYTKEQLNQMFDEAEDVLKSSYNNRIFSSEFDSALVNDVLRRIYLPYLQ